MVEEKKIFQVEGSSNVEYFNEHHPMGEMIKLPKKVELKTRHEYFPRGGKEQLELKAV